MCPPPQSAEIVEPFQAESWTLSAASGAAVVLDPIEASTAQTLGIAVAAKDPWQRMKYSAEAMAGYLGAREPGTCRRAIRHDGHVVGVVCVRHPWLRGPYLEMLALLPGSQGLGIGACVLDWMGAEVAGRANSLWVCTSTFNTGALVFYERHGFVRVGDLDGLVGPDFTEILLRKRL